MEATQRSQAGSGEGEGRTVAGAFERGIGTSADLAQECDGEVWQYLVSERHGQRQGPRAAEGSVFFAQLAALNDARAMAQRCRETQRQAQGGIACDLPPVRVKR